MLEVQVKAGVGGLFNCTERAAMVAQGARLDIVQPLIRRATAMLSKIGQMWKLY
jgi:hypothetical protein